MSANKHQIARQYRAGMAACLKGEALGPKANDHMLEGYEWAYRYMRPMMNDQVNSYVKSLGFQPFSNMDAMRG